MKIKDLRVYGNKVGRKGLALAAQDAIADYDGSYKGAMELCGKLSVLAKAATFDDYWHEQVDRGVYRQEEKIARLESK